MCVKTDDFTKGVIDGLMYVEREDTERQLRQAMYEMRTEGGPYDWYVFGAYLGYSFNHGDVFE